MILPCVSDASSGSMSFSVTPRKPKVEAVREAVPTVVDEVPMEKKKSAVSMLVDSWLGDAPAAEGKPADERRDSEPPRRERSH